MNTTKKILATAAALLIGGAGLTGCMEDGDGAANSRDKAVAAQQLAGFQQAQPVPVFNYSQLRQNLIEIETAQAKGIATTTFFFNVGTPEPIKTCPSIGYPIPSTYQLSNPDQTVTRGSDGVGTIAQIEANGVYTADSSGTYVICVDANGKARANYWEGYVETEAGPATWDAAKHQIVATGDSTATFSTAKR